MCEKSGHTLPISESKPQNKPHRERERETQGVGRVGIGRGTFNHQQTTSHLRLTTNGGIKLSNQSRKKILVGTLDLYRTNIYMMDGGGEKGEPYINIQWVVFSFSCPANSCAQHKRSVAKDKQTNELCLFGCGRRIQTDDTNDKTLTN